MAPLDQRVEGGPAYAAEFRAGGGDWNEKPLRVLTVQLLERPGLCGIQTSQWLAGGNPGQS